MPAKSPRPAGGEITFLARNRKALHDFEVLERLEAGVALRGTEVKVVRAGHAGLSGAYASVDRTTNEVWLWGVNIPPYGFGNIFNHDSLRNRKLLLHKREILKLRAHEERKGNTIVPLALYLKRGRVKCELGVCRGKTAADKRETIKRRESDRDARRAIAEHAKGRR